MGNPENPKNKEEEMEIPYVILGMVLGVAILVLFIFLFKSFKELFYILEFVLTAVAFLLCIEVTAMDPPIPSISLGIFIPNFVVLLVIFGKGMLPNTPKK